MGGFSTASAETMVNDGRIEGTSAYGYGVDLSPGGSVTNAASASITGVRGVEISGGAGTVANYGSIAGTGTSGIGIYLRAGGLVTNATSALITGIAEGVFINGGAGTVANDGSIAGTGTNGRGVELFSGGSVTNTALASIAGTRYGVIVAGGVGVVINSGSIAATAAYGNAFSGTQVAGVELRSGGTVGNAASASITGGYDGISVIGGAGTVVNYGGIGGGPAGNGVFLNTGGLVTNAASGTITGIGNGVGISDGIGIVINDGSILATDTSMPGVGAGNGRGVALYSVPGTVINDGFIAATGTSGFGVDLYDGGSVTNQAGGLITATARGVVVSNSAATVINDGGIVATNATSSGVKLKAGGSVDNAAFASISRGNLGVYLSAGGTVTDAGTIIGNTGTAISFGGTASNLPTLDPGYGLSGIALGGASATNTLELASATSTGTLSGLGTEFVGFAQTTIDADASWVFNVANTIEAGATLTELSGANLTVSGTLVNDGVIVIDPSTLTAADLTGTGQVTIDAGSTLEVQGTIAGGETIVFDGNGAFLRLASGGTVTATASGDGVAVSVLCFRAGTLILTPSGEHLIQELVVGDLVRTHRGEARPITWIGTRAIDCARHPDPSAVRPVRIRADALADGVPRRDLYVSPDHAMLLDGQLIPTRLLCNGATILQPTVRHAKYFHLELETHDILLAEGAPAESYLDTGNRAAFENADAPMILHPDFAHGQRLRETRSRAPFAADAEPVWRRLAARALALGYAVPEPDTTDDPDLRLTVDGREIRPLAKAGNRYVFALPPSPGAVRLLSRTAAPCEAAPWIDDRRRLGVKMGRITPRNGQDVLAIPPDHPMLADGWWAAERDGARLGRWTNGDAGSGGRGNRAVPSRPDRRDSMPRGEQSGLKTPSPCGS